MVPTHCLWHASLKIFGEYGKNDGARENQRMYMKGVRPAMKGGLATLLRILLVGQLGLKKRSGQGAQLKKIKKENSAGDRPGQEGE